MQYFAVHDHHPMTIYSMLVNQVDLPEKQSTVSVSVGVGISV